MSSNLLEVAHIKIQWDNVLKILRLEVHDDAKIMEVVWFKIPDQQPPVDRAHQGFTLQPPTGSQTKWKEQEED